MNKNIIIGMAVIVLGLLISLGPQFLFKVCDESCCCNDVPQCHWSARAEIGMGMLITALGICLIVFSDIKTRFGITIGIFLSGIIALGIPNVLIGGCDVMTMACHKISFPILSGVCILTFVGSFMYLVYLTRIKQETHNQLYH